MTSNKSPTSERGNVGLPSSKERTFSDGRKLAYTPMKFNAHENAKISGNTLSFYSGVCNTYLSLPRFSKEKGRVFITIVASN
jgi:hypothetical protein